MKKRNRVKKPARKPRRAPKMLDPRKAVVSVGPTPKKDVWDRARVLKVYELPQKPCKGGGTHEFDDIEDPSCPPMCLGCTMTAGDVERETDDDEERREREEEDDFEKFDRGDFD